MPFNKSKSIVIISRIVRIALLPSQVGVPDTFQQLANSVFNQLPKVHRVDFVIDTYVEASVKEAERVRRGTSEVFLTKGDISKIPRNWKAFMSNSRNKTQLI